MRFHIVIDTNVLVSALISKNSKAATVILLARVLADDNLVLLLDGRILAEYREVLHRAKFGLPAELADRILEKL